MAEIHIRRIFLQRDAEEIQTLQQNAPEFRNHYPKHNEWLRMAIREIVEGKRFAFGVYKTTFNEYGVPTVNLIGSIILKKETYTNVVQLKNLFIKQEERKRKYGRTLYKMVEQFCINRGAITIETEVPYEESGTVNFLNMVGFSVYNFADSPYLKGEHIYRMYKHLPRKYTGDPFDLFNLSCWLVENLFDFRIVSSADPNIHFESDFNFEFQTSGNTGSSQIYGSAYVFNELSPVEARKIELFYKHNKKYLLMVIGRNFSMEAKKFCNKHRILMIDVPTIERELSKIFAVDPPSFKREDVGGMIVPINSKYFTKLTELTETMTYFKGGAIGKYLKKGDVVLFYVEQSTHISEGGVGGVRAYAEIETCEVDAPQRIWEKYSDRNPMFPKDDFFIWCVDKPKIIALTFSKVTFIQPISHAKINEVILATPLDNERIGHFYLSKSEINSFLKNKCDRIGLVDLDRSLSPKIFLSSTIIDLRDEREYVIRLVRDTLKYNIFASEASGARQTSRETILEELKQSHIYICLVGERYGTEFEINGRNISATHDEFIHATNYNKFRLVYVKRVLKREQKAIDFLQEIGTYQAGVKYQEFSTVQELGEHITLDIAGIVKHELSKTVVNK